MLTDTKQPQPNPMGTVQTLQKNLGENGAGICKTCNSSVPAKSTEPAADGQKPNSIANIIVKSNQTDSGGEDDEISISKFSEPTFSFNKTLRQHNITETHNVITTDITYQLDKHKMMKLFIITASPIYTVIRFITVTYLNLIFYMQQRCGNVIMRRYVDLSMKFKDQVLPYLENFH